MTTTEDVQYSGGNNDRLHARANIPESDPDQDLQVTTKVYKRRWYFLFVYIVMCFCFGTGVFGLASVANAIEKAFCWTNEDIALLGAWQSLILLLAIIPMSWALDTRGIRVSVVFATTTLALGCGIRCLPAINPSLSWCLHVGTVFISFTGFMGYAGCTTFSNTWFPPNQRTLSTSLINAGQLLGAAFGSIISPILVPLDSNTTNSSLVNDTATNNLTCSVDATTSDGYDLVGLREDILLVLYINFGVAAAVWIASVIYFPAKPPSSPSITAASERTDFIPGMKAIVRNPKFWLITGMLALTVGPSAGIGSVMDVNLEAAQIPGDQTVTGILNTSSLLSGTLTSIGASILADRYRKYVKHILVSCCVLSIVSYLWFALIIQGIAPRNYVSLYVSYISGQTAILTPVPLYLEAACDAVYPIAEGLTTGFANIPLCTAMIIFLFLFFIPNIGTLWMNWFLMGSVTICLPLLYLFTPSRGRLQIDERVEDEEPIIKAD